MTTIHDIYNDFRTNFSDAPEYAADFFKRHSVFLNNKTSFADSESLLLFIELTWQELNSLFVKSHYNLLADLFENRILLIDSEINRLGLDKLKNDWYYGSHFLYGMSLYNLKEYKKSTPVFRMLLEIDSKNDQFRKWLRYSRAGQSRFSINIAWLLCSIVLFSDSFFTSTIVESGLRFPLLIITFIVMVTLGLFEFALKRSLRKTNLS